MKLKNICTVLVKVLIIIILVVAFNLIMMPKYINENKDGRVIAEMYREKVDYDVLFLGSSTVYSSVSPVSLYENFGITSYVGASSSQTPWQSYCVLKEALKINKPSLVAVDIGFMMVEDDYSEESSNRKLFDGMRPGLNKYRGIKDSITDVESMISYALPVLRFHDRYKDLSFDDFKYAFYKPGITYNGYIMNVNYSQEELGPYFSMAEAEDRPFYDRNRYYLQAIIDTCKENGIDVMLMKVPSYTPKWGPKYEEYMTMMANDNGIGYFNFDNYINPSTFDWAIDSPDGGSHLNLFGAEKFALYLGDTITSGYKLPDRRSDAKIDAIWSKKVDRYESDKLEILENR